MLYFTLLLLSMKPCIVFSSISPYLIIVKRDEILWYCERHNVEPENLSKLGAEYEQMWKWMVEFLSKSRGRGIKIGRVSSIRVAKSMIFFNILRAVAPWVTSWAIVFFALTLRLLSLVYILSYCMPELFCNVI